MYTDKHGSYNEDFSYRESDTRTIEEIDDIINSELEAMKSLKTPEGFHNHELKLFEEQSKLNTY